MQKCKYCGKQTTVSICFNCSQFIQFVKTGNFETISPSVMEHIIRDIHVKEMKK